MRICGLQVRRPKTLGAGPFLAAQLQSLNEFPASQGTDTLSMKKAVEARR
jgi:hypothetical protein